MSNLQSPPNLSQRIIGLTGGIAMGKTTISDYLTQKHQIPVLDADLYARETVQPGSKILQEIVERYGSGVLLPDGQLNRQRLSEIVFNSSAERLWLEQSIHPYVRDRLVEALKTDPLNNAQNYPIVVLVIPLLFEARMTDLVTETWVVTCPKVRQLENLMQRDSMSLEQAELRIQSQMAIEKKIARADVVINNSSTLTDLFKQIDELVMPVHAN
jgi:dephospho-CoA kinase